MTSNRWDAWEPQEPPEGFAGRTVAVLLEDRVVPRRAGGARWIRVAAAAAMLTGGAAWGFSAWTGGRSAPRMLPTVTPAAPEVRSMEPLFAHPYAVPDAGIPEPAVTARPRRPHVAGPESGPPDAGRRVIVPPCDCAPDQVICTCF